MAFFEVVGVWNAATFSFDAHDFAVDAFRNAVGDGQHAAADNVCQALFDHVGRLFDQRELRAFGPADPLVEESGCPAFRAIASQLPKCFLDGPGSGSSQVFGLALREGLELVTVQMPPESLVGVVVHRARLVTHTGHQKTASARCSTKTSTR